MRRALLYVATISVCFGLLYTVDAQQNKRPATKTPSSKTTTSKEPRQQAPAAVTVLIRKLRTGTWALDGVSFILALEDEQVAAKLNPEVLNNIRIVSERGIKVEEEAIERVKVHGLGDKETAPIEWKRDPAGFDYLINWTIDIHEHSKQSLSDKLKITVKENWKIELVKDSSLAKAANITYQLNSDLDQSSYFGPTQAEITRKLLPVAVMQTETVIAPARGPVLKEIRSFIMMKQ